jgi:hypothetical protein
MQSLPIEYAIQLQPPRYLPHGQLLRRQFIRHAGYTSMDLPLMMKADGWHIAMQTSAAFWTYSPRYL